MDQPLSLEQAAAILQDTYGETYEATYQDGKDAFAQTLQDRFHIGHGEAKQLVEGLERARTIHWQGGAGSAPNPEGSPATVPLVVGMWSL